VKNKVAFGLTARQLICFGTSAALGITTYILSRGAIGNSAAAILMITLMLPGFFLGVFEKDGLPAELILRNYLRSVFFWTKTRPYRTENLYEKLEKEGAMFVPVPAAKSAQHSPEANKRSL